MSGNNGYIKDLLNKNEWKNKEELNSAVEEILNAMTPDEKLSFIYGCGFNAAPVERLGIPELNMSDASMGMRQMPWPEVRGLEPATAFPATLLLAATWNVSVAYKYAEAVAEEFRSRKVQVLLGPGVNIYRHPQCGRNFEYMGEDPYLVSEMVTAYIKAVVDTGVMPVVKHFAANNSEVKRKNSNSVVDERTLHEIYFPAFKAAVQKAGTQGLMSAYNLLNGEYCGESRYLLQEILRDEWGFDGLVMSDWDSIWHTVPALKYGVDLEMPGQGQTDIFEPGKVKKLIESGEVCEEDIDRKVRNILRPCLRLGLYAENWHKPELGERKKIHSEIALETARQGIVLLKNEDILPVEPGKNSEKIVLIGPLALKTPTTGRGSGAVLPEKAVSMAEAFRQIYPDGIVLHEFDADVIRNAAAVIVCVGNNENFRIKDYRTGSEQNVLDDDIIMDEQASFNDPDSPNEGEGTDRVSFELSEVHTALIKKCAELNDNIIVNIIAGAGVEMNSWIDKVKAVLFLFYPGENGTVAAMEIISGKVNPSGRLPMSIEKNIEDNSAHENFNLDWGDNSNMKQTGVREYQDVYYKEGIYVGYRHFSSRNIKPLFCFGHGLSYSEFKYSDMMVDSVKNAELQISFKIENISKRGGFETAQVYVRDTESSVERPALELKAFSKVFIDKNSSEVVNIKLDESSFAFWSESESDWIVEDGYFDIMVGSSSENIHLTSRIFINASDFDRTEHTEIIRIISGGQTGADRGGLDAAIELNIPHGGACPRNRIAEDGAIPDKYNMQELFTFKYSHRTEQNVIDSDMTLVFSFGPPAGGSALTVSLARKYSKPCLTVDLNDDDKVIVENIKQWLAESHLEKVVLNIAGSRESTSPGINKRVRSIMLEVLK